MLELPVYRAVFWERAAVLIQPFVWPFVLGSTIGALVVASLAYLAMTRLIARVQRARTLET